MISRPNQDQSSVAQLAKTDRTTRYKTLLAEVKAVMTDDWISNLANTSALIFEHVDDINWAGFYLSRDGQSDAEGLILGPFQGRVACVRIGKGRGVCGAAALQRQTVIVEDVHQFPGHIACDSRSQSEIVVPLLAEGRLLGVLDVDSPSLNRFAQAEKELFEAIALAVVQTRMSVLD